MKPMSEQHFAFLCRHMVELIGMHMDLMSDELGKSTLGERVAAALKEVPRHLFVPPQPPPWHITMRRYRSASTRQSPSHSLVRS